MGSINIWMQLLGFEKNDPDHGAQRYLDHIGFVPDSICALLFNPDFVNLHRGMAEEYTLFPDNCAYHGIPRNVERERQEWTNYELKELVAALKKKGVDFYAGLMGSYVRDMFHHEWLTDHPEIRCAKRNADGSTMCLKRLKDGTYYEDFFAEKLVQTLLDYDFAGVHLADGFCPSTRLYISDYSSDMTEQFLLHTGAVLPDAILATMGDDGFDARTARAEYLWQHLAKEWIDFYAWRWEGFFRKICAAVHKVGKEVWILGMYCTDPFETRLLYGFDTARVMNAGVDCITANVLPTGVGLNAVGYPYYFHRIHMDLPLLRAQIGDSKIVTMVGAQDASEQWSVLEHQPVKLERDIYTMTSFRYQGAQSCLPATEGAFICLGDGISEHGWKFLKDRLDTGFDADAQTSYSPLLVWSDAANDRMLDEYFATRRPSAHKQCADIFQSGTPLGGSVRIENIDQCDCALFVPNYDLLTKEERAALVAYPGAWVGTVPAAYGDIPADAFCCTDHCSDMPLKAFLCNASVSDALQEEIETLCQTDDGVPSRKNEPASDIDPLRQELPFAKLNGGFVKACEKLLQTAMFCKFPVTCTQPMMAIKLKNGKTRLFIYNADEYHYGHAQVRGTRDFKEVKVVSSFPVLPVRFIQEKNTAFSFNYDKAPSERQCFQLKLAPAGVSVVEIE